MASEDSQQEYANLQFRTSNYIPGSSKNIGSYSFGKAESQNPVTYEQPIVTEVPTEVETENEYMAVENEYMAVENDEDDDNDVSDQSLQSDRGEEQRNGDYQREHTANDETRDGPAVGVEVKLSDDGACVSATAEYGSMYTKEICGGVSELDFQGPAVGCTLSLGDGPAIVSDCTTSACTANFVIAKSVLCSLGLSLDTKLVWNEEGAEFLVLGTGVETSEGFALAALGSKIGCADMDDIAKKREKRQGKRQQNDVVNKQPTGQTNAAVEHD